MVLFSPGRFWLQRRVLAVLSVLFMAMEIPQKVCKSCGYSYAEDAGRQHGSAFTCKQCRNILEVIRRNLGSTADIAQWTTEETHEFFRAQKTEAQDGRLKWTTVRAAWLKKQTEAVIRRFTASVEQEALPKTVWLQRGWEASVVDRFEPKWSDQYGTYVHELPISKLKWDEAFEKVEKKVLEQERAAAQKNQKKGAKQDLDVPTVHGKDEETNCSRAQAAEKKKIINSNAKIAAMAARSMGSLCAGEAALEKLLAKSEGEVHDVASRQLCQDSLEKMKRWGAAARAAINAQEANKSLTADAEPLPLTPLPYDHADLKVLLQQSTAGQKSLKDSLPKKEPKAT